MKVRFEAHDQPEIAVVVRAQKQTPAVHTLMNYLNAYQDVPKLVVFDPRKERERLITQYEMLLIEVQGDWLKIQLLNNQEVQHRERLYKFYAQLDQRFVQINKSTVVNVYGIQQLTVKFGQVTAELDSGTQVAVSRRYVKKLKEALEVLTHG